MRYRNDLKRLAIFSGVVLLVLALLYGGVHVLEDAVLNPGSHAAPEIASKTVTWNGVDYYPRRDITVLMLLGIDREESAGDTDPGELHSVMLLILDEKNESCCILELDRNTMLDIPVPDSDSKVFDRLARVYSGGTDLKDGCVNTRRTVSDFLGGITIDYYLAMGMDTVTVLKNGLDGAGEAAGEKTFDYVRELLSELVSDCPIHTLMSMLSRYASYRFSGVVMPAGEYAAAEGTDVFHADGEKLEELVIGLFYAPKRGQ